MILQFQLFGIPVSIHWSTVFLIALFFLDAFSYLKKKLQGRSTFGYISATLVCSLLIIVSIFIHEASHAIVANAFGYKITSAGMNGLFAYVGNDANIKDLAPYKEILICAAGPVSNLLLALLGLPLIYFIGRSLPEMSVRYFSVINFRLFRINLWPILFLDGEKIIDSALRQFFGQGQWLTYVMIGIGVIFMIYLFTKKKGRFELEQIVDKIP